MCPISLRGEACFAQTQPKRNYETMKAGIPIQELARRVQETGRVTRDYIADTNCVRMQADGDRLQIDGGKIEGMNLEITPTCHRQIGERVGIPAKYYDRCRSASPSLLAQNVNHWLHTETSKRMIRTLDFEQPIARAFLSERYRPLDNIDLINELLPLISDRGAEVRSCQLTESHLYLHASFPSIEREIKRGDVVRSGVVIRNSEVGLSSLKVQPWIERLVCMNGMVVADSGVRKYHVGRNFSNGDLAYELMSTDTKKQTDKAFWMQVQDVVKSIIEQTKFDAIIDNYAKLANIEVESPDTAVEITRNNFGVTEDEGQTMLQHLCEGGDYSVWGVANSVTRLAHNADSYDRSVELEEIGGQIMELPTSTWNN